jgi:hypothetical protein
MTESFIRAFFRDAPAGQHILLWTVGRGGEKTSHWCSSVEEAVLAGQSDKTQDKNTYFGVGTRRYGKYIEPNQRGDEKDVAYLYGTWIDIDIRSDAHAKENLPDSIEEAMDILEAVPLEPSYVINTGHGIQAYWLFTTPMSCGIQWQETKKWTKRFNYTFKLFSKKMGWDVDSVFDLTRVMRLPGTMNVKGGGSAPVTIISQSDKRYDPFEITEYLIDESLVSEPTNIVSVPTDNVTVSLSAQPPLDKFEALFDNHPEFKDRWNHKKPPSSRDDSMSSYDMSLASMAARNGWTVQEIVDLLVYHRKKYAHLDNGSKGTRTDYLIRTAKNAVATINTEHAYESVSVTVTAGTDAESPRMPQTDDEKAEVFKGISKLLTLPVTGFIKYDGDEPTFKIKVDDRWIDLGGIENITTFNRFQNKIAAHIGRGIPNFSRDKWRGVWETLMSVVSVETLADGGDIGIMYNTKLSRWITSTGVCEVTRELDMCDTGMIYKCKSRLYFCLDDFYRFIKLHEHENVTRPQLTRTLRGFGVEAKEVGYEDEGKVRKRHMWFVSELFR